MAKVRAPLLSFGGSGQIGKSLVFGSIRGVDYSREYVIPANPQTAEQTETRNVFAMLTGLWKYLGTLALAPWTAFAKGKKFQNRNAFIGRNVSSLRGDANMNNYIGSPGANGGPPMSSFVAATGVGSGNVKGTFILPAAPTGWTATKVIVVAFPNQDPFDPFGGVIGEDSEVPPTLVVTVGGMGSAVACQVIGFVEWTKPDTTLAYSVGITGQATSAA